MTPGQERAVRELERLRLVSDGCFVFAHDATAHSSVLVVAVGIRLGPMETRPGGLALREREEFVVYVPPGFPFDRPWVRVAHDRFAHFPHVVWSRGICLYQTSQEWNPADGLFGLFARLNLWLGRAAINDMDPVDGPLEPPHHSTDFSLANFVIRADAPVAAGERWIGLAEIERHPKRVEVVGWRDSFQGLQEGRGIALAVMLPEPWRMEFPTRGAELFDVMAQQGFERDRLMRFLALAALLTPTGEPVYLVLGLPMRRAPDGTRRLHIAVWATAAAEAESLRLVLGDDRDPTHLRELRAGLAEALHTQFAVSTVSWCRVMEDRPEIVQRRDARSPFALFRGKRVLVLGCGALGSWAAEMVARAGAVALELVDHEVVKTGLLARQNFASHDLGENKAIALAGRLRTLVAPGVAVQAFAEDAHRFILADAPRFRAYDVVLDCTASHLMQMKLERDWALLEGRTPALVSMVTDANAQYGLCVVVRRDSTSGPWDAYVRLKHRLCNDGDRPDLLAAFYDPARLKTLFQPEPGCSDPTFSGSTADATGIAGGALNLACLHGLVPGREVAIAFGGPVAKSASVALPALDEMDEYRAGKYRVRIARKVAREARAWVRQNNRIRTPAHETGGLLWGMWDDATEVIWIFDASGPPSDSRHDPGHFLCGIEGTAGEHARRLARSHGTSGFIGFWHTHPDMASHQSGTDIRGMAGLVSTMGQNQKRALMLIFGRAGARSTAGVYVYESDALTAASEYVEVGTTQVTLGSPVV
jgi:hypothetical protein